MSTEPSSVLIVEDDPGIAILQRRRLQRAGFQVTVTSDLDGALAALSAGGINIVLLDYRLGETTGLDLHRRMKANGIEVPVILVSGAMEDAAVVEALRAGIRDVVVKTTDYLDSLPDTVRSVLAQGSAAAAVAAAPSGTDVLVVEDEPGTATLERRRLERAGYTVLTAANADEALAHVRSGRVALAVLDLKLPGGVTGLDLYEQWQAEGLVVPAILVTGHADQAVVIRAVRMGIRDFVPKSDGFVDDLPRAVDRVMSQARVERKLAESELRLASVIGTTVDAILMCDAGGRVMLSNESAQRMFECSQAEMLERPVTRLIPRLSLATDAPPGQFRERRELDGIRCETGTAVPIEVSVSDVVIQRQRLFTVIARDITDRRRAEAERREADRRKDEFLGMLGHELRNPLAAIMNAVEVLHQGVRDARLEKLTGVVRRQAGALARMVDDLLDISRVTLGKIELSREPVLLGPAVARAVEIVGDAAAKAGLTLSADVDTEPVWIHADPTRLEQVLTNLITNAVKFTPPGGRIDVTAAREGAHAVIVVRDTGAGIPPALLGRVFDLFVQGDSTLDRSRSGLGIGLALVRQIVSMHGGTATAESEGPGRGSAFTVRLPLAPEDVRPPDEPRPEAAEPAGRLHLLVVDDQEDVADTMAVWIEGLGHRVHTAYDAAAALALARRERLDAIITDIGMPETSGYELAQQVRADPALKHLRLVALTGYGRDEDHARVMSAGFDLHLTKPVTDGALRAALAELSSVAASGHTGVK
jgi:PAS domain S-box-containing protein